MTIAPASSTTFEPLCAAAGDELAATALAAASRSAEWSCNGTLIVVVHPERDDHRILAAEGTGVLRAAVSVAIASGNHRLWADAPVDGTIEHQTRELPEVVRAAADASGVLAAHIGVVRLDDRLEGVAIWFETETGVTSLPERRHTLQLLSAAAERDVERLTAEADVDAPSQSPVHTTGDHDDPTEREARQFDRNDPDLDPLTGLTNRVCFEHALESYESDHATLVVIDIASRGVHIAGTTTNPISGWMEQIARNLTDYEDAFLAGKRFLVLDRDSIFSPGFKSIIEGSGTEILLTAYQAPNMNAYAERFVRSIKSECLDQMIFVGQRSLERAIK